mmetsp:Transcript_6594/g.13523  ORF Transcript_6594/g.13523 Transcript_6594/m.13523 type:complete len:376 (-) Transcript_6594:89-1216(-)
MVNWTLLQNATSPDNKPTPGWLFHEICQDVRSSPKDCPDVAEYLMQCVCNDQLNIQLKAVLCVKHLSAEDVTFQQYMQSCAGALKIMEDIAAPPIVAQARSLEPQEVKTVRDATQSALHAIHTPHTVEKSTAAAHLKTKIQGFGNFEPPPEEQPASKSAGVAGQVADFVGDSIGDMVDDFREKGAVGALKDASVDALDLVLDGVDTIWGWVAGKSNDSAQRICQPAAGAPMAGMPPGFATPSSAGMGVMPFQGPPPASQPTSASNHYAAAFGQGVVGANNPVVLSGPQFPPSALPPSGGSVPGTMGPTAAAAMQERPAEQKPPPPPMVDLLSMDEPSSAPAPAGPAAMHDLLGDMGPAAAPPRQAPAATQDMLDL